MSKFGTIVLVPFPFTDLTTAKVRPALVISKKPSEHGDVVVCFITSRADARAKHAIPLPTNRTTGLKVPSLARLDTIATLECSVLLGELGHVSPAFLRRKRKTFTGVFGF